MRGSRRQGKNRTGRRGAPHLAVIRGAGGRSVLDRITIVPLDDPQPETIDLTQPAPEFTVPRPDWVIRLEEQGALAELLEQSRREVYGSSSTEEL